MNQKKYKPETRERRLERLSKFVSLILRHRPEVIGITLDEHGWANVDELINLICCRQGRRFPREPIPYICDFSRGGLNVRGNARIQTLLRGHKYRG